MAGMESRPDFDGLKSVFPPDDRSDMAITRPDGSTVKCLTLVSLVDQQRLQTEVISSLSNSNKPVPSVFYALPTLPLSWVNKLSTG